MAYACDICGKTSSVGHRVSHAQNKTKRKFKPNLRKVRVDVGGGSRTLRVCARCLKSKIKVEVSGSSKLPPEADQPLADKAQSAESS